MAERKRRPPSNKVKPGTPHPTKAHTVRGFDGKWVTRKSFNAAKKARSLAKKGGALVKRTSSAVSKATKGAITKASKAGDLLKINKGDKGLVRGIKDTFKLGKDTRKSADALYKAGKITRQVHDKLVKGGKDFFSGVKEAGKATRRAYEKTKPGGKIVKTKGSKISKYSKPDSKIVKSPGGKLYKPKGGKLTVRPSDKGSAIVKTPKVKTKAKVTPKVESARRVSARDALDRAKRGVNKDTAFNRKYKVEGSSTNPRRVTKDGKVISEVNQGKGIKPKKLVKQAKTLGKKVLNKVKGSSKLSKGLKIGGKYGGKALKILGAADVIGSGYRQTGNLVRRIKKKPLKAGGIIGSVDTQFERDRIKAQNAYLKKHGSLKGFNKASVGNLLKKGKEQSNTEVKQVKKTVTPQVNKPPIVESGGQGNKQKSQAKSNKPNLVTRPSPEWGKKTESQMKREWLKKTRNSPAAKSGAFTNEERWKQHKEHKNWKLKMGRK